jgi:hypothetical protein
MRPLLAVTFGLEGNSTSAGSQPTSPLGHLAHFQPVNGLKRSLMIARRGVAILARTVFIESVGRYREIFEHTPPARFAPFTERVPMLKGRLDRNGSTATSYAWFVWEKDIQHDPRLMWVPPCRKQLERIADYREAARTKP